MENDQGKNLIEILKINEGSLDESLKKCLVIGTMLGITLERIIFTCSPKDCERKVIEELTGKKIPGSDERLTEEQANVLAWFFNKMAVDFINAQV